MTVTLAILRALLALWPFLREMFFNGKSFLQVVRENKLVTTLFLALCTSLALNYVSFRKIHEVVVSRRDEPGDDSSTKVPNDHRPVPTGPPDPTPPSSGSSGPLTDKKDDVHKRHDEDAERLKRLYEG